MKVNRKGNVKRSLSINIRSLMKTCSKFLIGYDSQNCAKTLWRFPKLRVEKSENSLPIICALNTHWKRDALNCMSFSNGEGLTANPSEN